MVQPSENRVQRKDLSALVLLDPVGDFGRHQPVSSQLT